MDYENGSLPEWVDQTSDLALQWYHAIRNPNEPITQPGQQTITANVSPRGASFAVSPVLLIVGAIAVVAIIYALRK